MAYAESHVDNVALGAFSAFVVVLPYQHLKRCAVPLAQVRYFRIVEQP